jgi:Regulator of ribonuclease activity B
LSTGIGKQDGLPVILTGRFGVRFPDEGCAQAAAREARCVGFVVTSPEHDARGWLIVGRRRQAFPADERERYASRLRAIADVHGGDYDGFVAD